MKKNKKKSNEKLYLFGTVLLLIVIFIYGMFLLTKNDNDILLDNTKTIVYTSYENKDLEKSVPAINVKKVSEELNNNISQLVTPYLNKENNKVYYKYQVNGNILSLIVIVEDFAVEGTLDVKFETYNIDLVKLKVLSNDEVLKMFGLDINYIDKVLNDKFKLFYEEGIKSNSIDRNISYEEYLRMHNISSFRDNIYLYINNSKLNVYLDYDFWADKEAGSFLASIGYVFEVE